MEHALTERGCWPDGAVEDDESLPDDAATSLPLRYQWIVWEQLMASGSKSIQYSESAKRIASCDIVEDFWQTCLRLPQPSELLSNRMALNAADRFRTIDARMVFREDITPQWEGRRSARRVLEHPRVGCDRRNH